MAKNTESPLSAKGRALLSEVKKTKNPLACSLLVKAAIERRDQLMGYETEVAPYKFEKLADKKARERMKRVVGEILKLTDRKDVSVLCGAAIVQRREVRNAA